MSIEDSTLPPVDAPFVPGGGPLHREGGGLRHRARGWLWCCAGAAVCLLAGVVLMFVVIPLGVGPWMLGPVALWVAALVLHHVGARTSWTQAFDRADDQMSVYARGVPAELAMRGSTDGAVRIGSRWAARLVPPRDDRTDRTEMRMSDGGRVLRLEERVTGRDRRDGGAATVEVRTVDDAGTPLVRAEGHRRGDRVDWTIDADGVPLRLRQRLTAVPRRRTLLDRWGRAWQATATVTTTDGRWSAQLPEELDDVRRCSSLWMLAHLDALAVPNAYARDPWYVVRPPGAARAATDERWTTVGGPVVRPEQPTGGGPDIGL